MGADSPFLQGEMLIVEFTRVVEKCVFLTVRTETNDHHTLTSYEMLSFKEKRLAQLSISQLPFVNFPK